MNTGYRVRGKRIVDVALALAAGVVAVPVVVVAGGLIAATLGFPVFFVQQRAGQGGRPFRLVKLRTMRAAAGPGEPDGERLTRIGRWLRASSIDELPQLWNVLVGDMSLVGPRPLFLDYVPLYDEWQRERLAVRPGITGWAQIHGRNALDWETRFRYDVWYVQHLSLAVDLWIMIRTLSLVVSGRGISYPGQATMEPFKGSGMGTHG